MSAIVKLNEIAPPFQRAALDASDVGTWEIDVANDRFRCDAATAPLYGLSMEEGIAGVSLSRTAERVHPEDRAMWRARRALSIREGGLFVIEYRVVSASGEIRWVLVRGRYDIEPDGRVLHARGIVIDLTESKRDGFAEGRATFVEPHVDNGEAGPLEAAASHALAAHRVLSRRGGGVSPALIGAADRLLQEIGLAIAVTRSLVGAGSTRH